MKDLLKAEPQASVGETSRERILGGGACVCVCVSCGEGLLWREGIFPGVLMVSLSPQRLTQMSGQL